MSVHTYEEGNRATGQDFHERNTQIGRYDGRNTINIAIPNEKDMQIEEILRAERERLGLTQTAMSKAAGVAFRTYCDYESGKSEPKASTLAELSSFGVDVLYVLTGKKTPNAGDFTDDEIELVKLYRTAPLAVKAAALAALTAGNSASNSINVSGQGNRVAGRDFNENKK